MSGAIRVSSVMAMFGLVDSYWFTHEGRERGKHVHAIAEAHVRGDASVVAPKWRGYQHAIEGLMTALPIVPLSIERRFTRGRITGRPDLVGYLVERAGNIHPGPVVLDFKSGEPYATHGLQLAFYEWLAEELREQLPDRWRDLPFQRVGGYLADTGRHRVKVYKDIGDIAARQALVTLVEWRVANGYRDWARDEAAGDDDPGTPW